MKKKTYSRRDKYFAARCTRRSNAKRDCEFWISWTRGGEARFERRARCIYTEGREGYIYTYIQNRRKKSARGLPPIFVRRCFKSLQIFPRQMRDANNPESWHFSSFRSPCKWSVLNAALKSEEKCRGRGDVRAKGLFKEGAPSLWETSPR